MNVIDQFSDPAFGLLYRQVSRMPALEPFVKAASVEAQEAAALPDTAFAWPSLRRFPLHTPEHAALSYAYAKVASVLPPFVEDALKGALEVYGVDAAVFEEVKEASVEAEDAFLLPELGLFPVKTAAEVRRAQGQLVENFGKLTLENRATACAALVKKADDYQVSLHPEVLKLAGLTVSSTKATRDWLEARSAQAKEPLHKQAYQTLANGLSRAPLESRDRGGLLKLASTIAALDEQAGLTRHYDRKLPDALRTVFNTEKLAAESVDVCGSMVPLAKLAALPASFWEDLGGPELSSELAPGGTVDPSKLAMVVETLPLDLKVILKNQLRL